MVKSDFKKSGKTTWVWRIGKILEKNNEKCHEFITCRSVFEHSQLSYQSVDKPINYPPPPSPIFLKNEGGGIL